MKSFSMPADFKNETIDAYVGLNYEFANAKVTETYGQITDGFILGSGRSYNLIPHINLHKLTQYVEYSKQNGIDFNYTLNSTCLGNQEFSSQGIKQLKEFLKELRYIGINSLTVAQPSLIELILENFDFHIKASTLCNIDTVNKALAFEEMNVKRFVVPEAINRRFDILEQMSQTVKKAEAEVIVNAICHKDCIYRMFHYNYTSHDAQDATENPSGSYYSHRCMMQRCKDASNILKLSWVRPEDIYHYVDAGVTRFKIQGRQAVMDGNPVRTVRAYMEESYDGDLFDLLDMFAKTNAFQPKIDNKKLDHFLDPYLKNPQFCSNNCKQCHYCENYLKSVENYDAIQKVYCEANKFYNQFDEFKQNIRK